MRKLSLSLALLAALAALALLAASCKKDEKPAGSSTPAAKTDQGAAPAKTDQGAAPAKTEPAKDQKPAGGGKYSPIPECDAVLVKLEPCMDKLAPDNFMKQSYEQMKEVVKDLSPSETPPAALQPVIDSCNKYFEGIKGQSEQICPGVKL